MSLSYLCFKYRTGVGVSLAWHKTVKIVKDTVHPQILHILPHTFSVIYPFTLFWCELLSFEDISYRVFCFLSSRMELVGNLLVVFKVPKNIHLLLRGDTFFSMYSWCFKLSWVCQSESATSADFSIFHIFRWINSTVGKSKKFGMKCPFNVTMSEIQRYTYQCIVFVYPYSNRIGVWAQTGLTVWIFKLFRCSNEPLTVEIKSDSTSFHCLKNECQAPKPVGLRAAWHTGG